MEDTSWIIKEYEESLKEPMTNSQLRCYLTLAGEILAGEVRSLVGLYQHGGSAEAIEGIKQRIERNGLAQATGIDSDYLDRLARQIVNDKNNSITKVSKLRSRD